MGIIERTDIPGSFVINDIELSIAPTSIQISKESMNFQWQTLRTRSSQKTKSGHSNINIQFTVPFIGVNDINNKLLPLIAELRYMPFCYVENEFVRDSLFPQEKSSGITDVTALTAIVLAMQGIQISISASSPNTIMATFSMSYFNYLPYTPYWQYKQDSCTSLNGKMVPTPAESNAWSQFVTPSIGECTPITGDSITSATVLEFLELRTAPKANIQSLAKTKELLSKISQNPEPFFKHLQTSIDGDLTTTLQATIAKTFGDEFNPEDIGATDLILPILIDGGPKFNPRSKVYNPNNKKLDNSKLIAAINSLDQRISARESINDLEGFEPIEGLDLQDNRGQGYGVYKRTRRLDIVTNNSINNDIIITDITINIQNILASIPLLGHRYATYQHIGAIDASVELNIKLMSDKGLKELNWFYDTVNQNMLENRHIPQGLQTIRLKNKVLGLFNLEEFITQDMRVSTIPGSPGTYNAQLSLIESGIKSRDKIGEDVAPNDKFRLEYLANSPLVAKELAKIFSKEIRVDRDRFISTSNNQKDLAYNTLLERYIGKDTEVVGSDLLSGADITTLSPALTPNLNSFANDITDLITNDPTLYRLFLSLTEDDVPGISSIQQLVGTRLRNNRKLSKTNDFELYNLINQPVETAVSEIQKKVNRQSSLQAQKQRQLELLLSGQDTTSTDKFRTPLVGDSLKDIAAGQVSINPTIKNQDDFIATKPVREWLNFLSAFGEQIIQSDNLGLPQFKTLQDIVASEGLGRGLPAYPDFQLERIASDPNDVNEILSLDPDCFLYTSIEESIDKFIDPSLILAAQQFATTSYTSATEQIKKYFTDSWFIPGVIGNVLVNRVTENTGISFRKTGETKDASIAGKSILDAYYQFSPIPYKNVTSSNTDKPIQIGTFLDTKQLTATDSLKTPVSLQPSDREQITHNMHPGTLFGNTPITINNNVTSPTNTIHHEPATTGNDSDIPANVPSGERKKINQLRPEVRTAWLKALVDINQVLPSGLRVVTGTTFRSVAEQERQFVAGRSDTENAGHHGIGAAIDFYLTQTGNSSKLEKWEKYEGVLQQIVTITSRYGFHSIAFNKDSSRKYLKSGAWDAGHIEYRTPQIEKELAALRTQIALNKQQPRQARIPTGGSGSGGSAGAGLSVAEASIQEFSKSIRNGQALRLVRAFPTFKFYFIQDDSGNRRRFGADDLFSYNSVVDITCVRSRKIPADLVEITLTNVSGTLSNRKFQAVDPSREPNFGDNEKPLNAQGEELKHDPNAFHKKDTKNENPLASMMVQPGIDVELRLGYAQDPDKLPTVFVGKIMEVEFSDSDDLVKLVCQSHAIELVQDMKGLDKPVEKESGVFFKDARTDNIIESLLAEPEVVHFGRWTRSIVSGDGNDNRGLLTNKFALQPRPQDDNIFPPPVEDLNKIRAGFGQGLSGGITGTQAAEATGVATGVVVAGIGAGVIPAAGIGAAATTGIGLGVTSAIATIAAAPLIIPVGIALAVISGALLFSDKTKYSMYHTTIWDVMEEMTLRHPGWVKSAVPYKGIHGPRMTMFFGLPAQMYFSADPSSREKILGAKLRADVLDSNNARAKDIDRLKNPPNQSLLKNIVGLINSSDTNKLLDTVSKSSLIAKERDFKQERLELAVDSGSIKPFRAYHLITAKQHIISNNIRASSKNLFNTITIQYGDSSWNSTVNQLVQDNTDTFTLKVDAAIPDEEVRELFAEYHNCQTKQMAKNYALSLLAQQLKEAYKGEITIIGNPNIKPNDLCYIFDDYSDLIGPVEVEQVIHKFSQETGFITEITPNMFVTTNEWFNMTASDAMSIIIEGTTSQLINQTPTITQKIADSSITTVAGGAAIGLAAAVSPLAAVIGSGLAIGGYFMLQKLVDFTSNAQPVIMHPLIHHGKPLCGGLPIRKLNDIWQTDKGRWFKEAFEGIGFWADDFGDKLRLAPNQGNITNLFSGSNIGPKF